MKRFKPGEQVHYRPTGRVMTVEATYDDDDNCIYRRQGERVVMVGVCRYRCNWWEGQRVAFDFFTDDEVSPIPDGSCGEAGLANG